MISFEPQLSVPRPKTGKLLAAWTDVSNISSFCGSATQLRPWEYPSVPTPHAFCTIYIWNAY